MKKITLLLVVMAFVLSGHAQKLKLVEGNVDNYLKGQKLLKVEFTYDNLKVGKMTEEDYIAKKVKDYNKKNSGSGDEWKEKWEHDKNEAYPYYFIRMFNMAMGKTEVRVDKDAEDADYIMIINTSFIEPGFNVGIQSKRASANMEVSIVSKDDPEKALAKFTITKSPGSTMFGGNYSTVERVGGCFENAGSAMAGYFLRKHTFFE
jgi:hypothetical protein